MRQIPNDHVPGQSKQLVAAPVEFLQTIKKMHQLGHLQRGVVPSLDTGVCSQQTKRFSEDLKALGDSVVSYTVSLDLPFAQGRFCTAEGITNTITLSDTHNHSFGLNYGVLIEGLPLPLLTRAVFVVAQDGTIAHAEYVPEVTNHPNYEAAIAVLKKITKA